MALLILIFGSAVAQGGLIVASDANLWPGAVVPFVIDSSMPLELRTAALDAMGEWQSQSVITFVPYDFRLHANWLFFKFNTDGRNEGTLGLEYSGANWLYVAMIEADMTGVLLHEIGHSIGLWHEQSRLDRDMYVFVDLGCLGGIAADIFGSPAFDINGDARQIGPYDLLSVMQYHTIDVKGCKTVVRLNPTADIPVPTAISRGDMETINRAYLGLAGDAIADTHAGYALASGDVDNDGYDDLVVGIPGAMVNGRLGAGKVMVYRRLWAGVLIQTLSQDSVGIGQVAEPDDAFGAAVALGYFNDDDYADLAVGVPGEDVGAVDAGAVQVFYGSADGLSSVGNEVWYQSTVTTSTRNESGDGFGFSLASGDLDGDGRDDLAIGAPYEDWGSRTDSGVVHVVFGSADGLDETNNQIWHQDISQVEGVVEGVAEARDLFGWSLAIGEFADGNVFADLAIGVPGEAVGADVDAGAVNVLRGSSSGLTASNDQLIYQDTSGVANNSEPGDQFGRAVDVADFDGDGYEDLAVGVPGEDWGPIADAGIVQVFYGTWNGVVFSTAELWRQSPDSLGGGEPEPGDRLGHALASGDFNSDGRIDLAMGAPGEKISTSAMAGRAHFVFGSAQGLVSLRDFTLDLEVILRPGSTTQVDEFGWALAAGDFDGDKDADLAIGGIRERGSNAVVRNGAVHVLLGDRVAPFSVTTDIVLTPVPQ